MNRIKYSLTIAAVIAFAGAASAQENDAFKLPKQCQAAAADAKNMPDMEKMQSQMRYDMQNASQQMQGMSETQRGLMQAMMKMNGPMMQGMMAPDADVAWICSMIPHHAGAIAMAKAGLRQASDPASKRLARETIGENEQGIKKLTAWLERHAKKEEESPTATPR